MFYLMTHSTHFIYGYMASDIWLRTILTVRKETRLAARVLLYAPSHRQDSTYHRLCYTNRRALAGTRNSSMGPPHEGSIRRPIAPWANALTTELSLKWTQKQFSPFPDILKKLFHICQNKFSAYYGCQLLVCGRVRRCQGRHVDGVADGLVAGGVDHVAQRLLGVLDAASLRIAITEKDQLLLLSGPQPSHTLTVHLEQNNNNKLRNLFSLSFQNYEGRKEMFYLTTHSTHFIYGYMASDIWLRSILIVRKETRCRHIGYSFRLTATVLLYAPSHRQDSTYHAKIMTVGIYSGEGWVGGINILTYSIW